MRPLALDLAPLLLLAASTADAVPITGYVQGVITRESWDPDPGGTTLPYRFTVGESVYLQYSYDNDPHYVSGSNGSYLLDFGSYRLATSGGFNRSTPVGLGIRAPMFISVTNGTTDRVVLTVNTTGTASDLQLVFSDPTGGAISSLALPSIADLGRFPSATLEYGAEVRLGSHGFFANVVPVADASDFPVPEPSTLALGAIGVGVLVLAGMRRRKGA